MNIRRIKIGIALLFAGLLLAACGRSSLECQSHADCPTGSVCVDNQCLPGPDCAEGLCPTGLICIAGTCIDPGEVSNSCGPNRSCPGEQTCVDGRCVPRWDLIGLSADGEAGCTDTALALPGMRLNGHVSRPHPAVRAETVPRDNHIWSDRANGLSLR